MAMEMPRDPIKACPVRLCAGGLLWNEAVGDFGCKCSTCGGWGFVHDEAAEQIAEANASKTFYQCWREFSEAWRGFGLALAYSQKSDRLCEFLAKLLQGYTEKRNNMGQKTLDVHQNGYIHDSVNEEAAEQAAEDNAK